MERICRQDRAVSRARRDPLRVQLPGLGLDVQARGGGAVRRRRAAGSQPELLFRLRAVDEKDLLAGIDRVLPMKKVGAATGRVLKSEDLSTMFGLDMAEAEPPVVKPPAVKRAAAGKRKPGGKQAAKPAKRRAPAAEADQPSAALRRSRLSAGQTSRAL